MVNIVYMLLFRQGNSNSLASIDLAAGYKGMESYNLLLVGLLTVINTYAGPIFWLLCLMETFAKLYSSKSGNSTLVQLIHTNAYISFVVQWFEWLNMCSKYY